MIEFIVYLVLAGSGDTAMIADEEYGTMEECMFNAGAYISTMMQDPEVHGTAKEWHDFDKDGDYDVVILELSDGAGDKVTVVCTEFPTPKEII